MFAPRPNDFWIVNSYGYPCYFSASKRAKEAWRTLLTFYDYPVYDDLKAYWRSGEAPWTLHPHAVESWKATFEEFGLLFVASGSNRISITPAGEQMREAAERDAQGEFAWVGLNLLLRYPLRGPRRPKSTSHEDSDLLLYRFFFSALLDLDGSVWRTELERILCRTFKTSEASGAIADVLKLRNDPDLLDLVALPVDRRKGAFYNSLNQVVVHAGMNHLLLESERAESPYGPAEPKRRDSAAPDWVDMVRTALRGPASPCSVGALFVPRLPSAPNLPDEGAFFDYMGARVEPMPSTALSTAPTVTLFGEKVNVLVEGIDDFSLAENEITGPADLLCRLARNQRVICSQDERWTYIVEDKQLQGPHAVKLRVRRARPITDVEALRRLIEGQNVDPK